MGKYLENDLLALERYFTKNNPVPNNYFKKCFWNIFEKIGNRNRKIIWENLLIVVETLKQIGK